MSEIDAVVKDSYKSPEINCCQNPKIIKNEEGILVCSNCGVTYGQSYLFEERRAFTQREIKNRRRTEPVWRNFGSRTVISNIYKDAKGHSLSPERRRLFSRLNKINHSLVSSMERNLWGARPYLNQIAAKLFIPNFIRETAWQLYLSVAEKKLTMGRTIKGFVSASLYAAIRIHEFPRLFEEVTEIAKVPRNSLHKCLGLIIKRVFPEFGYKYKPITIPPLVYRFGNVLKLSMKTQKTAIAILSKAIHKGLRRGGKDPKGLAAAALYMAAKHNHEHRTQNDISDVAMITEVTLRNRIHQIKKYIK
ncbi:MAG: hypothetical protein GF364_20735 [Candidatus Lokiarchaeota archaeon]|nr:hypothetical protein [Candidatus Lokiarchaeota archaeon]